jgi:hypothetical protein
VDFLLRIHILRLAVTIMMFHAGSANLSSAAGFHRGEINGTVFDAQGYPQQVHVQAFLLQTDAGFPAFVNMCQVEVDEQGNYVCKNLPDGYYLLSISVDGNEKLSDEDSRHAPSVMFYPGTTDLQNALLVHVSADRVNEYDMSLGQANGVRVSGVIADIPHAPALTLSQVDPERCYEVQASLKIAYNEKTGSFIINGVPNGRYVLRGEWYRSIDRGRALSPERGKVEFEVRNDAISGLKLDPQGRKSIHGMIEVQGYTALHSATVTLTPEGGGLKKVASVNSDGTFQIEDLWSGIYDIAVSGVPGYYIDSIGIGKQVAQSDLVDIEEAGSVVPIRIVMRSPAGTAEGSVVDSHKNATVIAIGKVSKRAYQAKSDESGRFSITDMIPDHYNFYAWSSVNGIAYRTRLVQAQYANSAVQADVERGGTASGLVVPLLDPVP